MTVGIGLELGATSLRAAVLERQGPTLQLTGWQEQPCDTGSPEALTQALIQLRRSLRVSRPVVLGIPSTAALMTTVEPLIVNHRRASLAVEFELQQHLPFGLSHAVWHYQWLPLRNGPERIGWRAMRPGGGPQPGSPAKALVVAMKRERLDERLLCCHRAGFSVQAAVVHPLAAVEVWLRRVRSISQPAVFLDLNESQVQWVVWTSSGVSVVPVAALTKTIAPDELFAQVRSGWEAVRDVLASAPRGATGTAPTPTPPVWLYGDTVSFPDLAERMASALQLSVERLDPTTQLRMGVVRPDPPERAAIAIGLALRGLGGSRAALNLLADRQAAVAQGRIRRVSLAVGGVCGIAAVALGLSGMLSVRQRHDRLVESLTQRERTYQSLRPELRARLKAQDDVQRRTRQLSALVEDRARLVEWFAELTVALPDDVWLTKFDGSADGQLSAVLEGRARSFQSVTQFIDRMKSQPGFLAVKPLSTNVVDGEAAGQELIAFAIHLQRTLSRDDPAS